MRKAILATAVAVFTVLGAYSAQASLVGTFYHTRGDGSGVAGNSGNPSMDTIEFDLEQIYGEAIGVVDVAKVNSAGQQTTGPYYTFTSTVDTGTDTNGESYQYGTWAYNSEPARNGSSDDFWDTNEALLVAVKAARGYTLYVFNEDTYNGDWSTAGIKTTNNGQGKPRIPNMSHISFYATDRAIPPAVVPIPPSAVMFGTGLLGLLGWRRRSKARQ